VGFSLRSHLSLVASNQREPANYNRLYKPQSGGIRYLTGPEITYPGADLANFLNFFGTCTQCNKYDNTGTSRDEVYCTTVLNLTLTSSVSCTSCRAMPVYTSALLVTLLEYKAPVPINRTMRKGTLRPKKNIPHHQPLLSLGRSETVKNRQWALN